MEHSSGRIPRASFGELPPNTLLTADEVGDWLQVTRRQLQRLEIPCIDLGRKTPRYQVKDAGRGVAIRHVRSRRKRRASRLPLRQLQTSLC